MDKIVKSHNISALVIGYPYTPQGNHDEQGLKTLSFIKKMQILGKDFILWDERFTTMMAKYSVKKKRRTKDIIDNLSACFILQSYLNAETIDMSDEF